MANTPKIYSKSDSYRYRDDRGCTNILCLGLRLAYPELILSLPFATAPKCSLPQRHGVADEMGLFIDDPTSRVGYLFSKLMRAARLANEPDWYCATPGLACSYMSGKLEFLAQRGRATSMLGPRFDIRDFHEAELLHGPIPMSTLPRLVTHFIEDKFL